MAFSLKAFLSSDIKCLDSDFSFYEGYFSLFRNSSKLQASYIAAASSVISRAEPSTFVEECRISGLDGFIDGDAPFLAFTSTAEGGVLTSA